MTDNTKLDWRSDAAETDCTERLQAILDFAWAQGMDPIKALGEALQPGKEYLISKTFVVPGHQE